MRPCQVTRAPDLLGDARADAVRADGEVGLEVDREPTALRADTPLTRPVGSRRSEVTEVSCRTWAPASSAASTRTRSSRWRRGA